jgi:NAD(P)H-hydrate epimerase
VTGAHDPFPSIDGSALAWIDAEAMREVDRVMVDDLGISLVRMMENAGRSLAELAIARFDPASVTVLAGPGGNGGGGIVAGRHLVNRGVKTAVVLADPSRQRPVPTEQLGIIRRMGVPVLDDPAPAELVLDALLGYGLRGDPRGRAADLIRWTRERPAPVLALDLPSGLDATSGHIGDPCVRAAATLTLAMPKLGLRDTSEIVGELFLADISVPPDLSGWPEPDDTPFARSSIVRIVEPAETPTAN